MLIGVMTESVAVRVVTGAGRGTVTEAEKGTGVERETGTEVESGTGTEVEMEAGSETGIEVQTGGGAGAGIERGDVIETGMIAGGGHVLTPGTETGTGEGPGGTGVGAGKGWARRMTVGLLCAIIVIFMLLSFFAGREMVVTERSQDLDDMTYEHFFFTLHMRTFVNNRNICISTHAHSFN